MLRSCRHPFLLIKIAYTFSYHLGQVRNDSFLPSCAVEYLVSLNIEELSTIFH